MISINEVLNLALEYLPLDGLVFILKDILINNDIHVMMTNKALDVMEELESLLVRNLRERIVWQILSHIWMQS